MSTLNPSHRPMENQEHTFSMPGMVYTPVEIGTIRIGHLEERNGRPTPVKDDKFSITRLVRRKTGWVPHPLHEQLLEKVAPPREGAAERKLREIPIRIMYDSPDLTVRSRFEAFDAQRKRPVCASTAAGQARRITHDGAQVVECLGPDDCTFAKSEGIRCKFFGRITVQIEGQTEADNGFVMRSTSINTLRNFEAKLTRYWAIFGRRLTGVPFRLVLRAKTTSASFWQPFYFCDLELPAGLTLQQAAKMARDHAQANTEAGLDVLAWEAMVRAGLDNGALAAASDIEADLMNEFYADDAQGEDGAGSDVDATDSNQPGPSGPALKLKAVLTGRVAHTASDMATVPLQDAPTAGDAAQVSNSGDSVSAPEIGAAAGAAPRQAGASDAAAASSVDAPVQSLPSQADETTEVERSTPAPQRRLPAAPGSPAMGSRQRVLPPLPKAAAVSQRPPVRQNPVASAQRRPASPHR